MKNPKLSFGSYRTNSVGRYCRIALISSSLGVVQNSAIATPTLIEAENMTRTGYSISNHGISSGQRITKLRGSLGTLSHTYTGQSAIVNLAVTYYDETDGACPYTLQLNGVTIATWVADQRLEGAGVSFGNRATTNVPSVALQNGDVLSLIVERSGGEYGRVDTIAIEPTIEAESMQRSGYSVSGSANASGQALTRTNGVGTLTTSFTGVEGYYSVKVHYFDESDGQSPYKLLVDGTQVSAWVADQSLGSAGPAAQALTSNVTDWIYLKNNSQIQLVGTRNDGEYARVDRLEIAPTQHYIETALASRFLSQATMGGNRAEIHSLARRISEIGHLPACEEWIDEQLALPRGSGIRDVADGYQAFMGYEDGNSINIRNFEYAWWDLAVTSEEQLRFRMAFSLSQIFVTSSAYWVNSQRNSVWDSYMNYYDLLLDNAFTSHRDILDDITYNPFMGLYLTYANNSKGDAALDIFPDENYAREIMQLFSCGVYSLDQNGNYILDGNGAIVENYDNEDIREMAEVFTGLTFTLPSGNVATFFSVPRSQTGIFDHRMSMVEEFHDTSSKELLTGQTLSAGLSGDEDIRLTLDALAGHPSTAPFLSRELIKRLTSSNPSEAYIGRVTQAWNGLGAYGNGSRGDFASVIKAILLDTEARDTLLIKGSHNSANLSVDNVVIESKDNLAGRMHEPILRWTRLYNYLEAESDDPATIVAFIARTKPASSDATPTFGQIPLRANSVFNFYDTEFSPNNGPIGEAKATFGVEIVAPEAEILSDHTIFDFEECLGQANRGFANAFTNNGRSLKSNLTLLQNLSSSDISATQFIRDLNRDMCNGQMPKDVRDAFATGAEDAGTNKLLQLGTATSLTFSSPDFSVTH